jgi:bifunctional UDP-N-acetylglucosamine pyrophosphorylase/glucosamine-1-phosphate N-acetyltransferase
MAVNEGHRIAALRANEPSEVMGINDRVQLAEAETVYRRRAAEALMIGGVSLADPARIDVRGSMLCECDVFIDVNCVFEGKVTLGEGVRIGANCVLRNCSIAAGSEIHPMSHVDESEVGRDCSVGPYARLRPGTVLADGARIGNFVETKKAIIGQGMSVLAQLPVITMALTSTKPSWVMGFLWALTVPWLHRLASEPVVLWRQVLRLPGTFPIVLWVWPGPSNET